MEKPGLKPGLPLTTPPHGHMRAARFLIKVRPLPGCLLLQSGLQLLLELVFSLFCIFKLTFSCLLRSLYVCSLLSVLLNHIAVYCPPVSVFSCQSHSFCSVAAQWSHSDAGQCWAFSVDLLTWPFSATIPPSVSSQSSCLNVFPRIWLVVMLLCMLTQN